LVPFPDNPYAAELSNAPPRHRAVTPEQFRALALRHGWQERTVRLLLDRTAGPSGRPSHLPRWVALGRLRLRIVYPVNRKDPT